MVKVCNKVSEQFLKTNKMQFLKTPHKCPAINTRVTAFKTLTPGLPSCCTRPKTKEILTLLNRKPHLWLKYESRKHE